jgi:glucose/arabinose dehydrogenase
MKKKYLFLTILILLIFLFLVSCSRIQGKPVITTVLSSGETSSNQESTTAPTDKTSVTGSKETIKNTGLNLKKLQDLKNSFTVSNAFPSLTFKRPLELQNAGDGSGYIFIVEQGGKIFKVDGAKDSKAELFLDISDRVDDSGNEKGLLGLAFHPDFKDNGQFFVNYTTGTSTVISRFTIAKDNPNTADSGSEEIIITFKQPYANHNGGKLAFGPDDGYLYIAAGDGGGAGDLQKNGQNLKTLLGKILRIDVDSKDSGLSYSIPTDNPFKVNKEGYREEIYAFGLRNPWRFSFDSVTGMLWAADVGQDKTEEIDIIQKGKNYGWNIMEGTYCYEPPSGCNPEGLELPIYEYQHPLGESVTGGYVYHGKTLAMLQNIYIYADFITGYIWGLAYIEGQESQNFTLVKTDLNISSFGIDEDQELYFTAFDGKIYKLVMP